MRHVVFQRGIFSTRTASHLLQDVGGFRRIDRPRVTDDEGPNVLGPRPRILRQQDAPHGMAHEERRGDALGVEKSPQVLHVGLKSIHRRLSPTAVSVPP